MSKARAEIEVTASSQKLAADLRAASAQFASWARNTARAADREFGKVGKNVGKGIGKGGVAIGTFAGNMITKGFDKVAEAAHDVLDFERGLQGLTITAKQGVAWQNEMRDSIRAVSKETAVSSGEILAATARYVDLTGDVKGATTMMRTFARSAAASNSSIRDVAEAAAAAGDAFHVKPEEMESMFSGLIEQGKAGAVTLKDFAAELTGLAPRFARFQGMMGREGMMQLGAALQVAKKGFGSASEAATGLVSMIGGMTLHADKFAAAGVKIFEVKNGERVFRNLHDIVVDIGNSKLAKDPQALIKAFGRKEGEQTFQQLNRLKGMYDEMYEAGQKTNTVTEDLAQKLNSPIGRIDASVNRLKERMAEIFTPERIEHFADVLETAVDKVSTAFGKIESVWDKITGGGNEQPTNPYDTAPDAEKPTEVSKYGLDALPKAIQLVKAEATMAAHDQAASLPGTIGDQERARLANRKSFEGAWQTIVGKGSRAEQVKAAERYANPSADELHKPGGQGRMDAANEFLRRNKVSSDEQRVALEAISKEPVEQAISKMTDRMVDAIKQLAQVTADSKPDVKIGDDQVAQSSAKAKGARGGWGD
jgi:TP901 family phage tail tape measure protein